ncbi:hypothetical protein SGPA1_20255 [Streptomyces misionensis JCM 4497]
MDDPHPWVTGHFTWKTPPNNVPESFGFPGGHGIDDFRPGVVEKRINVRCGYNRRESSLV